MAPPVVFELHPPWDCGFRQFSSVLHQSESLHEFGSQPLKQHLPVAELDACCSFACAGHQVGVAPPVAVELQPPWDCGFRQFSSVLHQSESLQEFGSQPLKQHCPLVDRSLRPFPELLEEMVPRRRAGSPGTSEAAEATRQSSTTRVAMA